MEIFDIMEVYIPHVCTHIPSYTKTLKHTTNIGELRYMQMLNWLIINTKLNTSHTFCHEFNMRKVLIHIKESTEPEGHPWRYILIAKSGRKHQWKCVQREMCAWLPAPSIKMPLVERESSAWGKLAGSVSGDQDCNGKMKFTHQLMSCNVEQE